MLVTPVSRCGSSPHTRGAQSRSFGGVKVGGIIPAYAGSTAASSPLAARVADHPRIRGEHSLVDSVWQAFPGSSPHTRGALANTGLGVVGNRIIPAYAGSTRRCSSMRYAASDHPRIRGEHGDNADYMMKSRGSSPHTRGAPRILYPVMSSTKDHPRIRGEHAGAHAYTPSRPGSSPHTRGAPRFSSHSRSVNGIIPAYAGSTMGR